MCFFFCFPISFSLCSIPPSTHPHNPFIFFSAPFPNLFSFAYLKARNQLEISNSFKIFSSRLSKSFETNFFTYSPSLPFPGQTPQHRNGSGSERSTGPFSLFSAVFPVPWLCLGVPPEKMCLVFIYLYSLLHIVSCTQENFPNCQSRLRSSAKKEGCRDILHQWMLIKNWLSC